VLAKPAADLEAVDVGQHEVEDDEVGGTPPHAFQRRLTMADVDDVVAGGA
jgi:hypothetical protein